MIKERSYQEKFEILEPWKLQIVQCIKKELKNEHLRKSHSFIQKYFSKKSVDKLTLEEITEAYFQEVRAGNEEIGDWMTSRYILKHSDVYHFFAQKLSQINPKFDEIEIIPEEIAPKLIEQSIKEFGAMTTYAFCILNGVVFSAKDEKEMRERALREKFEAVENASSVSKEECSIDELRRKYEEQISKLTDKYEKKLLGLQKKYDQDMGALKSQIKGLQKKLQEGCARIG